MAAWEKRLLTMRDDPRGHSYDDAASVLRGMGFEAPKKPKGSHRWWRHSVGARVGLLDRGSGPIPPEYIKTMIATLRSYKLHPDL